MPQLIFVPKLPILGALMFALKLSLAHYSFTTSGKIVGSRSFSIQEWYGAHWNTNITDIAQWASANRERT